VRRELGHFELVDGTMEEATVFRTRMKLRQRRAQCARRGTGLWNITQPNSGGLAAVSTNA
jgi:hypothetical protein